MNIKHPQLEDAHVMGILHSKTFEAPDNFELIKLKPGALVKVCASGERFWCTIKLINDDNTLIAVVDNELINTETHGLIYGDTFQLTYQNIYTIYED